MKKVKILLYVIILSIISNGVVYANDKNIQLEVNGKIVDLTDNYPVIEYGRMLVPLRVVSEELGAEVTWYGSTRSLDIQIKDMILNLKIDNNQAMVNYDYDKMIIMDVAPKIINSSTYVPLRFIAEQFGADVEWIETTKTVCINTRKGKFTEKNAQYGGFWGIKESQYHLISNKSENVFVFYLNKEQVRMLYDYTFNVQNSGGLKGEVAEDLIESTIEYISEKGVPVVGWVYNAVLLDKNYKETNIINLISEYGNLLEEEDLLKITYKRNNPVKWNDGKDMVPLNRSIEFEIHSGQHVGEEYLFNNSGVLYLFNSDNYDDYDYIISVFNYIASSSSGEKCVSLIEEFIFNYAPIISWLNGPPIYDDNLLPIKEYDNSKSSLLPEEEEIEDEVVIIDKSESPSKRDKATDQRDIIVEEGIPPTTHIRGFTVKESTIILDLKIDDLGSEDFVDEYGVRFKKVGDPAYTEINLGSTPYELGYGYTMTDLINGTEYEVVAYAITDAGRFDSEPMIIPFQVVPLSNEDSFGKPRVTMIGYENLSTEGVKLIARLDGLGQQTLIQLGFEVLDKDTGKKKCRYITPILTNPGMYEFYFDELISGHNYLVWATASNDSGTTDSEEDFYFTAP